ncbi:hypothetical protein F5Y13DRAFT_189547 [Hypoxylon sp. FL1857]|nr:hypothetical protein F5Y13DRAFT_189547 [Hypoxylon sp. FL1857]
MATSNQTSDINTTDDSVHPRLDDFLNEPMNDGNRIVMLPDRPGNAKTTIKEARKRAKMEIEKVDNVLNGPKTKEADQ